MNKKKISSATIRRLSIYRRMLSRLEKDGVKTISSEALGQKVGSSAAQIRKDLSLFGEFGEPGTGYSISLLRETLSHILGTDRLWNTALIGVGRLGSALLSYPGFSGHGFKIVAAFDNDITRIGKKWEEIVIEDVSRLPAVVEEKNIQIVILAVPAEFTQKIARLVVESGVKAILNFAPVRITVPQEVRLRNVSFSSELESLSYFLLHETGWHSREQAHKNEKDKETDSSF